MDCKQRVSVVVLVVLAAMPVSGALCAMLCGSSTETASTHHGSPTAPQCDEPAHSSTGIHIEGVSEQNCSAHDAAVPRSATGAAERIGLHVASALSAARHSTFNIMQPSGPVFEYTRPPGWAPPAIPLILRV